MATANEIAAVLRFLASGWVTGEDNQRWLIDAAEDIERSRTGGWIVCALCQETICDENCPLKDIREGV